jgi:streptogramin lyase
VSTGIISTIAGSSTTSYTGNNVQATSATFNKPFGIAIDSANNIYITDASNSAVRKIVGVTSSPTYAPTVTPSTSPTTILPTLQPSFSVSPTYFPSLSPHSASIISTIAGTGVGSYSGDGGQATSASIYGPLGIAIDASGNVYFSDHANQRVRKITTSTGIITTYAGTGSASYNGDGGAAISAAISNPNGLCIDSSGTAIY